MCSCEGGHSGLGFDIVTFLRIGCWNRKHPRAARVTSAPFVFPMVRRKLLLLDSPHSCHACHSNSYNPYHVNLTPSPAENA